MTGVVFMPDAQRERALEHAWWLEHRPKNPILFMGELQAAIDLLKTTPNAGRLYRRTPEIRVCLLPGSRYQLY